MVIIVFGCLFGAVSSWIITDNRTVEVSYLILAAAIGISCLVNRIIFWYQGKLIWRSDKSTQNKTVTYRFFDAFALLEGKMGTAVILYEELYDIIETAAHFYLMPGLKQVYIVVKANCDQELISFLHEKAVACREENWKRRWNRNLAGIIFAILLAGLMILPEVMLLLRWHVPSVKLNPVMENYAGESGADEFENFFTWLQRWYDTREVKKDRVVLWENGDSQTLEQLLDAAEAYMETCQAAMGVPSTDASEYIYDIYSETFWQDYNVELEMFVNGSLSEIDHNLDVQAQRDIIYLDEWNAFGAEIGALVERYQEKSSAQVDPEKQVFYAETETETEETESLETEVRDLLKNEIVIY